MSRRLYAILDNKADMIVGPLMMYPNDVVAVRGFGVHVENNQTDLNKYPDDFEMIYVGNIDETTGQINSENVTTVCTARQWLDANKPDSTQLNLIKE